MLTRLRRPDRVSAAGRQDHEASPTSFPNVRPHVSGNLDVYQV